jgi:hypothetical protein
LSDRIDGWLMGMDFARAARFPQFEDKMPLPARPVTREWLDGFAAGILACHEGPDADEIRAFSRRLREPAS